MIRAATEIVQQESARSGVAVRVLLWGPWSRSVIEVRRVIRARLRAETGLSRREIHAVLRGRL
jgi:hypothetical protein